MSKKIIALIVLMLLVAVSQAQCHGCDYDEFTYGTTVIVYTWDCEPLEYPQATVFYMIDCEAEQDDPAPPPIDARVYGNDDVVIYGFDGYAQIYSPDGELLLQVDGSTQLPYYDGLIGVYYLPDSDEYQINIYGEKLTEIISPVIGFNLEVQVKES